MAGVERKGWEWLGFRTAASRAALGMASHLTSEKRLDILRAADLERRWYSLDDNRVCLVCNRVFCGRQVEFIGRAGAYLLQCPTPGCPSLVGHWLLVRPASKKAEPVRPPNEKAEFRFFLPDGA